MKQGEVWLVDFSTHIEEESDKRRPVIIVNHDSLGILQLKVVVPVSDASETIHEWQVALSPDMGNGFANESMVDCFQIKSISNERFLKRLGRLSQKDLDRVKLGLMMVLDMFA